MPLGLRGKLLVASIVAIVLGLVVGDAVLTKRVDAWVVERTRADLLARLALVEKLAAERTEPLGDLDAWDRTADDLGKTAGVRVTIVDDGGRVVGDSEVDRGALAKLESHAQRPEIAAARQAGRATVTRHSATLGRDLVYAAVPFRTERGERAFVRVAMPLEAVADALQSLRRMLVLGAGLALVVAVLLSTAAAQLATRPLARLAGVATKLASGDLAVRATPVGDPDFEPLGRALDELAKNLSTTLRELRTERDLSESVLDGMQEGVLLLDGEGRVALVNPGLRRMLLLGSDVVGKTVLEIVRHADLKALVDRAREAEEPVLQEVELGGIKPRRLLVRASRHGASPRGLLCVFVDVTELRRLESLRRDFVSNASHELRTPIASILSAADTLRDGALADPAAAPRFVDIVARNAERLRRLADDLLELSRIESGELSLALEPEDVGAALRHQVGLFHERAEKKRIRLVQDVPDDLPRARFDRRALETVLSNLVDNAIKYCPDGSEVRLAARLREGAIELDVADDGPGIEAKHLPRLFERFYRVDAGRSRDVGGTGLGLAIVKHLVEAMDGKVVAISTVGEGTTFRITLPQAAPELPPSSRAAAADPRA